MWQLTGMCNLHCKHCLRQRFDKPTTELSNQQTIQLFKDYIQFHKNHNETFQMTFSGGNPLIKPCFKQLMYLSKKAKDEGICTYTNILGNTDTIDQQMFNCLKECKLDSFFVSMDGIKQHHDQQRGPGNYDHNIYWIPKMIEAGIDVKIKYTLSKLNMNDIVDILDMCLKFGCKTFAIGTLMTHDDKIVDYINSIDLTPKQMKLVCLNLLNYIQNQMDQKYNFIKSQILRFNRTSMAQVFEDLGRIKQFRQMLNNQKPFNHQKKRFHNSLIKGVIWEDGSIHQMNRFPATIIGKYPEQTFEQIYENNKNKVFQNKEKIIPEQCYSCSIFDVCKI